MRILKLPAVLLALAASGAAQWEARTEARNANVGELHTVTVTARKGSLPNPCTVVRIRLDHPAADLSPPVRVLRTTPRQLVFQAMVGSNPGIYRIYCMLANEVSPREIGTYNISAARPAPVKPPPTPAEVSQLRSRVNRIEREISSVRTAIQKRGVSEAELKTALAMKADANTVSELDERYRDLEKRHDASVQETRAVRDRVDSDIRSLKNEQEAIRSELQNVKTRQQGIAAQVERHESLKNDVATLYTQNALMGRHVTSWGLVWGFIPWKKQVIPPAEIQANIEKSRELRTAGK